MRSSICALVALTMALLPCPGHAVTISNMLPRHNISGMIIDAHDGSYNQWTPGGPWYYYAMGYGTCKQGGDMCHGCGYGYSWIGVWQSADMANSSWTLLHDARDESWPHAVYFRVHVVFNKATARYVLWVNLNGGKADYAVGTSTIPEGPFKFVNYANAAFSGGGDFDILVDTDGAAYLIYTATRSGHVMSVERLADDYLTSLAASLPPPPPNPAPPPPGPVPPVSGFVSIGDGACRDHRGVEPPFWTNEEGVPSDHVAHPISAADCVAACKGDLGCTGLSTCGSNSCAGACHIYTPGPVAPASKPGAPPVIWTASKGGGGDANNISMVTNEPWWSCYRKAAAHVNVKVAAAVTMGTAVSAGKVLANYDRAPKIISFSKAAGGRGAGSVGVVAVPTVLGGAVRGPVKSNVSSGVFGNSFVEAPVFFLRKGVYYALFGNCCCFCGHGSGIGVYTAPHPLGPWTYHDNVGCTKPTTPGCGCGMNHGGCDNIYGNSVTKAQQNFIIQIPTPNGTQYVWTGDRWQSAADGIKAHDLQYWSVLEFESTPTSGGIELPKQFSWEDTIEIAT